MTGRHEKSVIIGILLGAHGVRGDVRIRSLTDSPDTLFSLGPLQDATGQVVITPLRHRPAKSHYIVTPKEPRQKEDWDAMKGTELHVPRARLPDPGEQDVYIDDLVGLQVTDPDGTRLGHVHAVLNHGAGDLIEIKLRDGGQALIPFTYQDVPDFDLAAGTLVVATLALWSGEDDAPDAP